MLPAIAILLFFGLGVAFFVISSKDDFGIRNLKNTTSSGNDVHDESSERQSA